MSELSTANSNQDHEAFSRLQEFSSEPIATAEELAKQQRMQEMEEWANGIGAHTERLVTRHREISEKIGSSAQNGKVEIDDAKRALANVSNWRTGVDVSANGDIQVHDHYPYSGDTPAGGWRTYRSPKNIRG